MKRGFTLVEILVIILVVGILATFAFAGYHNLINNSKAEVCKTNLITLLTAVDTYGFENNQIPLTLSQLKKEHLEKAWAKVLQKKNPWKIKLAYFLVDLETKGLAYAQTSILERYTGGTKYLICPADETPPPTAGCFSYGLDAALSGITYDAYKALPATKKIIAESDTATFPLKVKRHKRINSGVIEWYGMAIRKNGIVELEF